MSPLRAVLLLILAACASLAVFVRITAYDIGADQPHGPLLRGLLEALRERSIADRAQYINPPRDLADHERARRGAGHYDSMCADCHLAPGRPDSAMRKGLYPQPQNLTQGGRGSSANDPERSAARQFWIIQHGIKMTGMPAWSEGLDNQATWDIVALLQLLPNLSPEEYAALVDVGEGPAHAVTEPEPDPTVDETAPGAAAGSETYED